MTDINEIKVFKRNVYGNILIYPLCDKALAFCRLINKKTITQQQLELIERNLGFKVVIEHDPGHQ